MRVGIASATVVIPDRETTDTPMIAAGLSCGQAIVPGKLAPTAANRLSTTALKRLSPMPSGRPGARSPENIRPANDTEKVTMITAEITLPMISSAG